jgi:hypothetical protein
MIFQVVHQLHPTPAQSPYRVAQQETGREVIWVNRFLDRECILIDYTDHVLHTAVGGGPAAFNQVNQFTPETQ